MRKGYSVLLMMNSLLVLTSFTFAPVEALDYGMDTNLGNVNASFWGEKADVVSGCSVAGAGDVNGDGYDDILIGANGPSYYGNQIGQTFLILGKATGWAMDTYLSTSDASFLGEEKFDYFGHSVAGAGDVNGDGYDDILIGAHGNDDGGSGTGQTYLILGKASGWSMDTDLSGVDASFWGENEMDNSGWSVAGAGDVNGDGYDDILIGALWNDDGGYKAGQTYLILGKPSGWVMHTDLSLSDASFWGENQDDCSGHRVTGGGDVNGDGYDDILIGARWNDESSTDAGRTYLILGKATGWSMDTNLSVSDASFWGEESYDYSGGSIACAGDVNGDGYDDILIGADGNDDSGRDTGQIYLIFGKASGWSMDTNLSVSDASFLGEKKDDNSGYSVAGGGDVNGDGYDDILIGARYNDESGTNAGQTYLILGKASGWSMGTSLSASDSSFWGEGPYNGSGNSVAGVKDVNGDGYDDILVGAVGNDDGGDNAGQTYLIFPDKNYGPLSINSIKAYSDYEYTHEVSSAKPGEKIYLELQGLDEDVQKNIAEVWVRGSSAPNDRLKIRLLETGENTGKFRGEFTIANRTHSGYHWIDGSKGGWVEISSQKDPTMQIYLSVGPELYLAPRPTIVYLNEDDDYSVHFNAIGGRLDSWTFNTNAPWLSWDKVYKDLTGIPSYRDVGAYWVHFRVEGDLNSDEINFTIVVYNVPPLITVQNILFILQDQLYHVDYNSTDDSQGNITWHLITNANWLSINSSTGVLNGTPTYEDIGIYLVNVSVSDGNGGWDFTEFDINVEKMNDSDGDGFYDINETEMGSNPYDQKSTPLDFDADGWNNSIETEVGTDPCDNTSFPPDMDKDLVPDSIDPDRDGDGVLNVDDAFPDDRSKWDETDEVEEGSSVVWWIVGVVVLIVVVVVIVGMFFVSGRKRKGEEVEKDSDAVDKFGRVGRKKIDGGDEEEEVNG